MTNALSRAADAGYGQGLAGWRQALTAGHPQFVTAVLLLKSSLASDLAFTAASALAMESLARRRGEISPLAAPGSRT